MAGYTHRLLTDLPKAPPGTGRRLLQAAEHRGAAAERSLMCLDRLAGNAWLNAYHLSAGYQVVGHKAAKPQPGRIRTSFTLLGKSVPVHGSQP
ncbi:hypothetical protein [Streptomyces sp. NPDC040750]|uniref:hypothetical protein n=1 Tax=Streptomyces sp. NPDC040750 TaxID=3154491 RepID=UPI0033F8C4DD